MCVSDPGRETLLRCSVIVCCTWYLRFQQRDTISGSSRETLSPVPAERHYYAYRVVLCCGISGSSRETLSPVPEGTLHGSSREALGYRVLWYLRSQQRDTTLQSAVVSPVPEERHYIHRISGSSRETLLYIVSLAPAERNVLHHVVSPVPAERHHFRSQKKHYTIVCCSVSGPSRETLQYSVR